MAVLVSCKNEEDPIKIEDTYLKVLTKKLIFITDRSKAVGLVWSLLAVLVSEFR